MSCTGGQVRIKLNFFFVHMACATYSKNGWMNEDLTKDWIFRAWGLLNFYLHLLVWDAYKCHIMDSVSNHARRNDNSNISVIPGGLTGHLQPAYVPGTSHSNRRTAPCTTTGWPQEKSHSCQQETCALDKALCLRWVKEARNNVISDMIRKSFRVCGISVNPDGSKDGEIHSIKEG